MYLNKILLKEFGKFNNKELELKNGINLIYGEKESGKTTIKDFIIGVIYGMNQTKGLGGGISKGEDRKPIGGRDFSGKAYIKEDGKSYFVEKGFNRNSRKTQVLDVQTGREITITKKHTLYQTMTDVDKSSFINDYCVGCEEDGYDKSLAPLVETFVVNTIQSGNTNIDKAKTLKYLEGEYKKQDPRMIERKIVELSKQIEEYNLLDDQLLDIKKSIKELEEEFAIETARRKREARTLLETEEGVKYKESEKVATALDKLIETNGEISREEIEEIEKEIPYYDKPIVIAGTALFVLALISLIIYIMPFEPIVQQLFIICTALFIVITIVDGLYAKGVFDTDVKTPSEDDFFQMIKDLEDEDEEINVSLEFAKEFGEKRSKLKEVEKGLLNLAKERQQIIDEISNWENKKAVIEEEREAIKVAIQTIDSISTEITIKQGKKLLNQISKSLCELTNGKYQKVIINNRGNLFVQVNDNNISMEKIPNDDIKLIFLVSKLCAAKENTKKKMPIIIDDMFANWDKIILQKLFNMINSVGSEQVILLTSNKKINSVMDELGMDYNYLEI